jgi:hypothetical protein
MNMNSLSKEISNLAKSLNQILYEILILISFYLLFTNIKNNQTLDINPTSNTSHNPTNYIGQHKSFIILCAILVVAVDWFIWNNVIQTTFFIGILAVYIYYNLQNLTIISTFINLSKDIYNASPIIPEPSASSTTSNNTIPELPEILRNTNIPPIPFDAATNEIREVHEVYKSDKPYVSITDTKYAEIMLNDLYSTPQYKNIQTDEIDSSLDNKLHNVPTREKIPTNEELLNSFRNPKKEFLDSKWLNSGRTYNDNCVSCKHPTSNTSNTNTNAKHNAICTVVPFGRQLSECTNQDNTITPEQLNAISDNKIINNQ